MDLIEQGPALTLEELVAFEQEIGGHLPDDYKRFLLESNGGFPTHPVGFELNGETYSIFCFEMLLKDDDEVGLGPGLTHMRALNVDGFLPIASIDVKDQDVCVSFLDNVGEVRLAVYEYENEVPVRVNMVPLANSFSEFAEGLIALPVSQCPIEKLGQRGSPSDLEAHLQSGHSVDDLSDNGFTIIQEAIKSRNIPMISACIDRGASLSKTLHQPVTLRSPDILTLLVDAGADVNEQDESGHRPLYYVGGTSLGGEEGAMRRKVQELLLQHGGQK